MKILTVLSISVLILALTIGTVACGGEEEPAALDSDR